MKAQDLMIGDWVYIHHGGKATHYGKVTALLPSGAIESEIDGSYALSSSVEPIHITPEILEKNGFEKQEFDGWEFNYLTEGGCLIYEVLWRCDYPKYHTHLTIKSYSPDFGSFKSFRIDSVHELQHALRLCGIKKEIML